jgi:sodium/potassium-transporting ATPase subunit alpha
MRDDHEIVFEIPFNSLRKWHLVIVRNTRRTAQGASAAQGASVAQGASTAQGARADCEYILMMKGAPEVLIQKCSTYRGETNIENITDDFNLDFQDAYLHFGKEGKSISIHVLFVVFNR